MQLVAWRLTSNTALRLALIFNSHYVLLNGPFALRDPFFKCSNDAAIPDVASNGVEEQSVGEEAHPGCSACADTQS